MLICGIDDAGRGPVIGPLVIAGILVNESDLQKLVQLGVKDSKLLSPRRREELAEQILGIVKRHSIVKVQPWEVDAVVEGGRRLNRLNRLEARVMARIISELKPDIVYVDASDVLPERFKQHILEEIPFEVKIVSEHKADKNYPVVSAASIIAKVERDREIESLKRKYGDFGSGYPTDPKTINFLRNWIKTHDSYPDFVRKSWKTAKEIFRSRNERDQRILSDYWRQQKSKE
ncbi:MAG: ribonuclease HII [Candidatus Bathyarchaeia archaeon]|nr:ribonuclease HII [Candidatus Bathyarchaeota archaeon]